MDVLDGHGQTVTNAESRVDGAEATLAQHVTDAVRFGKCIRIDERYV